MSEAFPRPWSRGVFAAAAILSLIAVACGGAQVSQPASPSPTAAARAATPTASPLPSPAATSKPAATAAALPLPPGAENMKVAITAPAEGAKVTANEVALRLAFTGFQPTCDLEGKDPASGKGHVHVVLDKALIDAFCTNEIKVSLQNVKAGKHTLMVIPAINNHLEVEKNAQAVNFEFAPSNPLPDIAAVTPTGPATIKIVEPKAGATVTGDSFDLKIEVANFKLNCALEGKPNVGGYGHWHLHIDNTTGPMGGLVTMLGMSCQQVFRVSTAGVSVGKHAFIAMLTDNLHAPVKVVDMVELNVAK